MLLVGAVAIPRRLSSGPSPPFATSQAVVIVIGVVHDRIAIRDVFDDVGSKYVPPHVNIFYCFGGLVFTSFIAQVTTGAAMTFYYVPEVSRSLSSVAP